MKILQSVLAILFLILGIGGLLWSFLPPSQDTIALPLQEVRLKIDGTDNYATLMTPYMMYITLPNSLKFGGDASFSFSLNNNPDTPLLLNQSDVNLYDHFNIFIELRPDFENMYIEPAGTMSTPFIEGQDISMTWKISNRTRQNQEGVFWVYFSFYPIDLEQETQRTAILAKQINIETQSIIGLNTNWTAVLSASILTASLFLGWPGLSSNITKKNEIKENES
ncbi:MAG: hypothetical protein K8R40_13300 [Anaerolineaceae bacterium]|nr:hypothetical protein [Anaerolineaceae bacterium]